MASFANPTFLVGVLDAVCMGCARFASRSLNLEPIPQQGVNPLSGIFGTDSLAIKAALQAATQGLETAPLLTPEEQQSRAILQGLRVTIASAPPTQKVITSCVAVDRPYESLRTIEVSVPLDIADAVQRDGARAHTH
jgi:hypothetical protein